jgi:hypothetical protein
MLLALFADLECLGADQPVTSLTVLLEQSVELQRSDDEEVTYKKCI